MSRGKRHNDEDLEAWGRRTARETGYDAGNLRSLAKRVKKITISKQTAARWAREARVPGMKLFVNTKRPTEPWAKTSGGHTITRRPSRAGAFEYALIGAGWDHHITFTVAGFLRAVMTIERHLGPLVMYIDGAYVDDEDPGADLMDDIEDESQLELFEAPARRMAA